MSPRMIVGLALKVSIMLTLFGFGLRATREDLLYLPRRPQVLVRSLVAMFVVMPLFAILMTRIGSFNRAVIIALIALSRRRTLRLKSAAQDPSDNPAV